MAALGGVRTIPSTGKSDRSEVAEAFGGRGSFLSIWEESQTWRRDARAPIPPPPAATG